MDACYETTMTEPHDMARSGIDDARRFVPLRDAALILGLQFLLLTFRLGQVPLLGPDEPRYARVAVEMARASEFVRPTLAGEAWLEKPPLYYWLAGLGFRALGENEGAARWPAVFAALLLSGITGLMGARLFGEGVGRISMLIAATAPLDFAYGRVATMDMLVAGFVSVATGLLILSQLKIAGKLALPVAWAVMAVAFLAKGPIGFLIPMGSTGLLLALTSRLRVRALAALLSPRGILAAIAIAGPWVAAISLDQGRKFFEVFLLNHNLERFTTTIHNHPGPFYYYVPVLLLGVFPWTGLLAPATAAWSSLDPGRRSAVISWAAAPLILFSLAGSKLPGYILPCLPPLAIALAIGARRITQERSPTAGRIAGLTGVILAAALGAVAIRGLRADEPWGRSALMPALWLVATMFLVSRAFQAARRGVVRLLSISAAGFLLLLTLVAPPVLEAMESGRRLFIPAQGREVLVAGAWRTAWMAGYFYNDGHVAEVASLETALRMVDDKPRLLLLGPAEWRQAQKASAFTYLKLAVGAHETVLVRAARNPER